MRKADAVLEGGGGAREQATPATPGARAPLTRPRRIWSRHGRGLAEAIWLFLTLRIALSIYAFLLALDTKLPAPCTWSGGPPLHREGLDFRLIGVWLRWDACWYEKIATLGYRQGDPSVNFFPLFPLLQRLAGLLLGGNLTLAGLLVAGAAYIAAIVGLQRLLADDFDREVADRAVLYLSVFPGAFFFFAPFSESLFLALSVWALLAARRGAWEQAGIYALLLGLTRFQGAVLCLPLAWECYRRWRAGQRPYGGIVAALMAPCGLGLFLAYGQFVTGRTTLETQRTIWGNTTTPPWELLGKSWRYIAERGSPLEAFNLATLLLFCLILALGFRRLPVAYTLLAAPQLGLLLFREGFYSPLVGVPRYLLVIFPVFVIVAGWGRHRRLHLSWLIVSLLLLALLCHAFLTGAFVA